MRVLGGEVVYLTVANFNRDTRGPSRGGNFGRRDFGGRGSDRPQMYKAVCSRCGKDCEVPFKPSPGGRPIFCNDCFKNINGGSDSRRPESRSYESRNRDSRDRDSRNDRGSSFGDRRMFDATCSNCGNPCKVPFQPSGDKPIFCSNCFEAKNEKRSKNNTEQLYKQQFEALNTKLDRILELLGPVIYKEISKDVKTVPVEEESVVMEEAVAPEKKKKRVSKKAAAENETTE